MTKATKTDILTKSGGAQPLLFIFSKGRSLKMKIGSGLVKLGAVCIAIGAIIVIWGVS